MQEKLQNISPIKQRILLFIEYLRISKREFYEKTGISRGTMDNSTGITEETLTKLFATYNEISHSWLFTGEGEMLLAKNVNYSIEESAPQLLNEPNESKQCKNCVAKDKTIKEQVDLIDLLKTQLDNSYKNEELFRNLLSSTPKSENINKQSA